MPAMAIRFQCAACSQPIEVDDEWASRAVTCPYCRKAVTAPTESTLDPSSFSGSARSLSPAEPTDAGTSFPPAADTWTSDRHPPVPPRAKSNWLAIVGFVFSLMSLAAAIGYLVVSAAHTNEIMEMYLKDGRPVPYGEAVESMTEKYGGTLPSWMLLLGFFVCGGFVAWLAGLVCSIIAVTRSARRGLAIFGIVLAVLAPVAICTGGMIIGVSNAPPQAPATSAMIPWQASPQAA